MKHIVFIRHAESEFNRHFEETGTADTSGFVDCGITEKGKEQCDSLNSDLTSAQFNFDAIVVSPMRRCLETVHYTPALNSHPNKIVSELCREFKQHECDFFENEKERCLETEELLQKRIEKFKDFLVNLSYTGTVAVISHGDFIYHFCEPNKQSDESFFWLDNAAFVEHFVEIATTTNTTTTSVQ